MIESMYISLIFIGFSLLILPSFVPTILESGKETQKFLAQMILLGLSAIVFGALAAASANVEIITCSTTVCTKTSFFFDENMFIFGFLALIAGVFALIKSFDAFNFAQGKL